MQGIAVDLSIISKSGLPVFEMMREQRLKAGHSRVVKAPPTANAAFCLSKHSS
jgi:hypothetical protein